MLKNLIKTALRNLYNSLGYSSLNILGLTLGITSALFLMIYVADEVSYDRYNEKADRIYRVSTHVKSPDDEFRWNITQVPFGPQVVQDYPEVQSYVRFFNLSKSVFKYKDKEFFEDKFFCTDTTVFDIFTYEFVKGDPIAALLEPNKIVLTESTANKYFGDIDPIGKSITTDNQSFEVTGVIKDVPINSHFRFNALASMKNLPKSVENWIGFGAYTYLLLPEDFNVKPFELKIREMYDKYMAKLVPDMKDNNFEYILEPITKIHLYSTNPNEPEPAGSIAYIYIFSTIVLFLILIAAMNYINFATARSAKRAREVGLRKTVGASRFSLIIQFLSESTILTIMALVISVVLIELLLPQFNILAGKSYDPRIIITPTFISFSVGIIVLIGILGGCYPAFYLSRFNPSAVLKGEITKGSAGNRFRKVLVVTQFVISIVMIVCTLMVYKQINFLKRTDQGYDQKNIISFGFDPEMKNEYFALKRSILQNPNILSMTSSNRYVGEGTSKYIFNIETEEGMSKKSINAVDVDHDFVETFGLKIMKGRDFQEDIPSDTINGVVVSESFVKRMNWAEPIGKKVELGSYMKATVIGVFKDYHAFGMYSEMESMVILYNQCNNVIYVKLSDKDIQASLRFVESKWKEIFPEKPFEYSFLTDRFNQQFSADEKRGTLFSIFTILAILIAGLGLFGLISYTVEQRTKEIGIRKVVGASENTVVKLISTDYLILVSIAMVIAFPIAYYLINKWLQNYVYRDKIGVMIFILSAVITIVITFTTISYKTYKVAILNPSKSLKYE